ncbi:hypothetical protein C8J55DRAFT_514056 [Lentinula edodes]|uniref:Uncharacterized protein n=1 Tax=Lentinula lateritia TaxID=40482 RepID=A0A9W9ACL1_9AGAR|nr:hypothetical protein C8J55DRAFT_514056 [Lentinula edodes]
MCYLLNIATEYSCGHCIVSRRERIDCNSATCALSNSHRLDCGECTSTCRQSLRQDQRWISGRLHRPCESCISK